jgi:DeoR family transcriptional regulator of aga operon
LIDACPAMLELAKRIRRVSGLTVMTNGLDIAVELADADDIEVICTGGMLNKETFAFHGAQAEQSLADYRFDKVFLGAEGFGIREGITTRDESIARMKRAMIESAAACIVMIEASVFGHASVHHIISVDKVDTIVTGIGMPAKYRDALERLGVEIVLAD